MSLRFRALRVELNTAEGQFGTQLEFPDGLVVLQAENTAGKSSSLMAMLYALGLDGMLGPAEYMPLPRRLRDAGRVLNVQGGRILVELSSAGGTPVTIERNAYGVLQDRQVIRVHHGQRVTKPAAYEITPYTVGIPGSATREIGFHHYLAEYVGFKLPTMSRMDGGTSPLYLESLFPYFFVDQLTGWRDLKSRMPTYLQIPEMSKRSAEFVLALNVLERTKQIQQLEVRERQLRHGWSNLFAEVKGRASAVGALVRGLPDSIQSHGVDWDLAVLESDEWRPIEAVLKAARARLATFDGDDAPLETAPAELVQKVQRLESELSEIDGQIRTLGAERSIELRQLDITRSRIGQLQSELRKYKDIQGLRARGVFRDLKVEQHVCPTCDQPIEDVLVKQPSSIQPLSVAENVGYLEDQKHLFENMERDAVMAVESRTARLSELTSRMTEATQSLQVARKELGSRQGTPSATRIQDRLRLEAHVERLASLEAYRTDAAGDLLSMIDEFSEVRRQLRDLRGGTLSSQDKQKLERLDTIFRDQLSAYQFKSIPIEEMGISDQTYRPCHRLSGSVHDVGLTSASDAVRMVWAYVLGLLELAREFSTNHLGTLILDEPKQQSTADLSFEALLRRAALAGSCGQQVIFATSQSDESLSRMLAGVQCSYKQLPSPIFRRL